MRKDRELLREARDMLVDTFPFDSGKVPILIAKIDARLAEPHGDAGILQLPPLTDVMYHAVRGSEYHFTGGGDSAVAGYLNDDCLDEIWDNINTALRCAGVPALRSQPAGTPEWAVKAPTFRQFFNMAVSAGIADRTAFDDPDAYDHGQTFSRMQDFYALAFPLAASQRKEG